MSERPEPFLNEARTALSGVVRLFLNNASGLDYFRLNLSGLMASFAALFISWIFFLYAPGLLGVPIEESASVSLLRTVLSQASLYCGVALFVKIVKQEQGFITYVIVHNWASLFLMPFQIGVLLAPEGIMFLSLAGVSAFSLVFFLRTTQIIFKASFGQVLMLVGILVVTLILLVSFTGFEFWGIQPE